VKKTNAPLDTANKAKASRNDQNDKAVGSFHRPADAAWEKTLPDERAASWLPFRRLSFCEA
jgi:hypothetical protein